MYIIDILRVKFDVCREGSAAQTNQSARPDRLDEFRQIICSRYFNSFIDFLFLIRLNHDQRVISTGCGTLLFNPGHSAGNAGVDRCTDERIGIAKKLSYFDIISFLN